MENKKYYTVLYEATYADSGVISYKPVKTIKGYYDEEKEIFTDEATQNVYNCVNMAIPLFGRDDEHLLDALSEELEEYVEEGETYFAFPIEEELAHEYCQHDEFKDRNPMEVYEREVRGYFLYSVYDEEIDDNIFYMVDKYENHAVYNIDITLDIVKARSEASTDLSSNQQVFLLVSGDLGQTMEDEDSIIEEQPQKNKTAFTPLKCDFDPDELEEKINSEVIGQEHVVKALVSMMYKNKKYINVKGLKSNMLIFGPSGCGKTEIVRSLSRHLDVPMTIFDATSASASGYVGNSVTQAIKDLISVCNGDVEKAEQGIIVIDEIDKLASPSSDGISKGDVQDELFKMLEGDEITIAADSFRDRTFRFNPNNVTFIGIGSAQALIEQKKKDKNKKTIGFSSTTEEKEETEEKEVLLEPEDLIKFGLKPELLRRFPVMKVVKQLKTPQLVTILKDSKISNLKLYETAFKEVDNVVLLTEPSVYEIIAEKSLKEKAGASGLKRVVDDMLQTAVRKIRLLEGAPGELLLSNETVNDPEKFKLYKLKKKKKEQVYPPREKVKTIGKKNG